MEYEVFGLRRERLRLVSFSTIVNISIQYSERREDYGRSASHHLPISKFSNQSAEKTPGGQLSISCQHLSPLIKVPKRIQAVNVSSVATTKLSGQSGKRSMGSVYRRN